MLKITLFLDEFLLLALLMNSSFSQENHSLAQVSAFKGRDILVEAINAIGGRNALESIESVTRDITGTRYDQGQGSRPVLSDTKNPPALNYLRQNSTIDFVNQRFSTRTTSAIFGGQSFLRRTIISNAGGANIDDATRTYRTVAPLNLNSTRAAAFRRYPEGLLVAAWNRRETVRWLGTSSYNGDNHDVVTFSDADGAQVTMYFDANTHMLAKQEQLGDNTFYGDVVQAIVYDDWRTSSGVKTPFRITDRINDILFQEFKVSTIIVNVQQSDSLFLIPTDFALLDPIPTTPSNLQKLGEGIYVLLGSYNSVVVDFTDYILVLEGGNNSTYTQASIREIKRALPKKPIKYVVSTHFHFDHLGGIRSYVAEGTIVVTTADAQSTLQYMLTSKHLMRPDMLSTSSRQEVVEVVNKNRVFSDATHRVELYDIGPNPHAAQIIIGYLPKEKILFEGDMYNPDIQPGGTPNAGDDTEDLAKKIKQLGLQVERIVPVHGRLGTIHELQKALQLWKINKSN